MSTQDHSAAGNLGTRCLPHELEVRDVVGAVSYLCGAASRMVTGQVLAVDGGSTMRWLVR